MEDHHYHDKWREDLKEVLIESGGRNKETTFLIAESQLNDEFYLEDIDLLLNSGEIPNLFSNDESQEILELIRLAAQGGNSNLDISALSVLSFFVNRCKQNIHIIMCFSPIGASFRRYLRQFPSLAKCCTIDWLQVWPEEALEKVAKHHMTNINLKTDIKDSMVSACKYFHVISRATSDDYYVATGQKTYITSTAYLELITSFKSLITVKQDQILKVKHRYMAGLDRLLFAAEQVTELQKELSALRPRLVAAAEETAQMMSVIERETSQVEKASAQVREDEKIANIQAAAAQELKSECEADLAQAIPILEDAIAALNTLKPTDITLVKSMKNPPDTVKLVMAAVCVMKDIKPDRINDAATGRKIIDYWGPSKKLLGDMYFLQSLKDFDKDNIPIAVMKKIRTEYLPNKDFKPHVVAKASSAAEGLCKWVMAMDMYDAVKKEVAPKKAKLQVAEREYNSTVALLEEKRAQVRMLEDQLAELNAQLNEANKRKKLLEEEVEVSTNKLVRAEKLIGGLGGEKTRWSATAEYLQKKYDSLAGDLLLACGVIAYLSPFTAFYRKYTLCKWHNYIKVLNIPSSENYNFINVLGSEMKIQNWKIAGLPQDEFTVENAVIVDNSKRWSLMIDPQGQANSWIKNMEMKNNLVKLKLNDSQCLSIIENCVKFGKPLLLENVGKELETPLESILKKQLVMQGDKTFLHLGKEVVEYNKNFRLYMTTKMQNPHYLPEVLNKVTLVNFVLTPEGLEDQLLAIVIKSEKPELEETRQRLIVESAAHRKALKKVEDDILITLSQTQGNILEDESAIKILDSSKVLSEEITLEQEAAKETQKSIDSFRKSYQPVAHHSSILYYCIDDLSKIDPMYQFSLEWFISLYILSHGKNLVFMSTEERLKLIRDTFTYNLYNKVCHSLFEKDKLLFSFLMCTRILISNNKTTNEDVMVFLKANYSKLSVPSPCEKWLDNATWGRICYINKKDPYQGLCESIKMNEEEWMSYQNSPQPLCIQLPDPWETKLSDFHKLILITILHPAKITAAVTEFIIKQMGSKYVSPPQFDIERCFEDSDITSPIIFILSPNIDPADCIKKFSERKDYASKLLSVSLGQGQEEAAEELLKAAQMGGKWLCLQNCHLAPQWMETLERLWENIDSSNTKPGFRLWLTSYSTEKFPQAMLQKGVKMINEPPAGLKQNILHSFLSELIRDPQLFYGCKGKDKEFRRLLYGLCFFHAVIQERTKYESIGWNIPYCFDDSDLNMSVKQLQVYINDSAGMPYDAITCLVGECIYGGHISDEWDQRVLNTILSEFINSDVVNNQNYHFYATEDQYNVPVDTTYHSCLQHIMKLPVQTRPEVLGLHENAGIMRSLKEGEKFIKAVSLINGLVESEKFEHTEAILLHIASDILLKMPEDFDLNSAAERFTNVYEETMNRILIQEIKSFNKLLKTIRSSLKNVKEAVSGHITMTAAIECMSSSLLENKIPNGWRKVSYPCLKPLGNFIRNLMKRVQFFKGWCEKGTPSCFWLSAFFFTHSFLSAVKLKYARKHSISINKLAFDFKIMPDNAISESPSNGVCIYGLFMDGARWDRDRQVLTEQYWKCLRDPVPIIWIQIKEKSKVMDNGRYKCPLYKTSERRGDVSSNIISANYVLPILLSTTVPAAHWVKRGVALLCQLDT